MHVNLSAPAGFDLWKNLADQTSFVFMEHNEESMQMISRVRKHMRQRSICQVQTLIGGFGSNRTPPASVDIVFNVTSCVIYICIQLLEKPSESVISSLMRASSWSGAKIRADRRNLILSHPEMSGSRFQRATSALLWGDKRR